ncbi:uncharacterized protein LOC100204319 [Hydra vulgaris]|uniref:Dual specificity protein kinase TTK n=1 Tax=Hydra vulgaris TaxID=6087 RepID=T2MG79_HYDVU|nr:serine/threonine-protein kinase MPS1 [Hydra vulgaris]
MDIKFQIKKIIENGSKDTDWLCFIDQVKKKCDRDILQGLYLAAFSNISQNKSKSFKKLLVGFANLQSDIAPEIARKTFLNVNSLDDECAVVCVYYAQFEYRHNKDNARNIIVKGKCDGRIPKVLLTQAYRNIKNNNANLFEGINDPWDEALCDMTDTATFTTSKASPENQDSHLFYSSKSLSSFPTRLPVRSVQKTQSTSALIKGTNSPSNNFKRHDLSKLSSDDHKHTRRHGPSLSPFFERDSSKLFEFQSSTAKIIESTPYDLFNCSQSTNNLVFEAPITINTKCSEQTENSSLPSECRISTHETNKLENNNVHHSKNKLLMRRSIACSGLVCNEQTLTEDAKNKNIVCIKESIQNLDHCNERVPLPVLHENSNFDIVSSCSGLVCNEQTLTKDAKNENLVCSKESIQNLDHCNERVLLPVLHENSNFDIVSSSCSVLACNKQTLTEDAKNVNLVCTKESIQYLNHLNQRAPLSVLHENSNFDIVSSSSLSSLVLNIANNQPESCFKLSESIPIEHQLQKVLEIENNDMYKLNNKENQIPKQISNISLKSASLSPKKKTEVSGEQKKLISKDFFVNGKCYKRISFIGKGGSCKVFEVQSETGETFALKRVNFEELDSCTLDLYLSEIKWLEKFKDSPHIIRIFDWENTNSSLLIVMEKGDTDLGNILRTEKFLSIEKLKDFWKQMLSAVLAIHRVGVVHADLKPANFLLVGDKLKLIDFGIANGIQANKTSITRELLMGTLNYMPPEALNPDINHVNGAAKISCESDVWSLGCILYMMVFKKTPYQHIRNQNAKMLAIQRGEEINFSGIRDQNLLHCLKVCLKYDKRERQSVEELLQHPFLQP